MVNRAPTATSRCTLLSFPGLFELDIQELFYVGGMRSIAVLAGMWDDFDAEQYAA
jgi:hypothetical protein